MNPKYIIFVWLVIGCIAHAQPSDVSPSPIDSASRKEELKKRIAVAPKLPEGQVFQPSKDCPKDKELDIRLSGAPAFICASSLANFTRKEVFISARVQSIPVPEIVMKGYPSALANEIIAKLKEVNISVVEVGPYTLALVDIPINYPQPSITLK